MFKNVNTNTFLLYHKPPKTQWFKTTVTYDSAIWAKLDKDKSPYVFWAGIQEVFFLFN